MPSNVRAAHINIPESARLADLYGILVDLDAAHYLCGRAEELSKGQQADFMLIEGIVCAAVVRYGRCLESRVRLGILSEQIALLTEDMQSLHRFFKDLRDKFVAHSVNPFEASFVTASVTERDGELLPIQSVSAGHSRIMLTGATAYDLARLLKAIKAIIKEDVRDEEVRVLAHLQGLPIEVQHSYQIKKPLKVEATDVGKARKR